MDSKPTIIFVCHRIPYPPDRGDKIRSYNLLKQLSKDYNVLLGCCYESQDELKHLSQLKKYTADIHYSYKSNSRFSLITDLIKAFFRAKSVSEQHFTHGSLLEWVNTQVELKSVRGILIYCSSMAQYIPSNVKNNFIVLADLIDLDSHKWLELSEHKKPPLRWLYRRESKKIADLEETLMTRADYSFFVSQKELSLSKLKFGQLADNVGVIENGVDLDYFSKTSHLTIPHLTSKYVVYTGSMDGIHNVESIIWFMNFCWPKLAIEHQDLKLYIVGRRPSAELKKYATDRILFEPDVPDIRPYIANASLVIAPMRHSRGVQNKILEAMASGKAIVTTKQGAEGIQFPTEQHPFICANHNEFINGISKLLKNDALRKSLGNTNKEWVKNNYIWQTKLESLNHHFHGKNQC